MLGDGEVFAARAPCAASAISRRLSWPSVALGVGVQVAAQVGELHQAGQASVARRLDLAAVLAQLRRNEGQADAAVDRCLVLAGDALGCRGTRRIR